MSSKAVRILALALVLLATLDSGYTFRKLYYSKKDSSDFSFQSIISHPWIPAVSRKESRQDVDRIAGGYYAVEKQFPFMAVIHRLIGGNTTSQCGGTVLSKRWVLTAGHCIAKAPHRFLLVFGVINKLGISYDKYRGSGVSIMTNLLIVHPEYFHSKNDIGLLYMPVDIPFTQNIQPIALISQNETSSTFRDVSGYVIGWGKDTQNSSGTTVLKYAIIPIIEDTECARYWQIDERNICTAPGLGHNACQGDSGGPLVVRKNNRFIQIGIVSFGDADCPSGRPGVFTRIATFLPWLEEVTGLKF